MANTAIEWCEKTWNPITGCSPISEGCKNCYAARMAKRLAGRYGYPKDDPLRPTFHPGRLDEPRQWKKPCHIFVCSMGDLFYPRIWLYKNKLYNICDVISECSQHTFLILTKRPGAMAEWFVDLYEYSGTPIPNLWLGTTVENQDNIHRVDDLLSIPAAKHFVSVEPMLGPVTFGSDISRLDWAICGAETGPGKRPMNLNWARSLRDECVAAGVPFFFKRDSNGSRLLDGREWNERP